MTLDVLADAVLLLEQKRRIVYMNATSRSLFKAARIDARLLRIGSDYLTDFQAAFPDTGEPPAQLDKWLNQAIIGIPQALKNTYESSTPGREYVFEVQVASHPLDGHPGALVLLRDITQVTRTTRALQESEQRFRLLTDMSSEAVLLSEGGIIADGNAAVCTMLGYSHDELIGMEAKSFIAPECRDIVTAHEAKGDQTPYELECLRKNGSRFSAHGCGRMFPFQGRTVLCTTLRDMTLVKQGEQAMRQSIAQEEKIRAQAEMLAELSTPLIPLSNEIMVMPLIGSVDTQRAQRVIETLLDGIARSGAKIAILDITGVTLVDADVANALITAARAVRLLGAQVVLSGIRSEVAQTLVRLGADMSGIITHGTLQNGIAYAMARRG
jgi:rsbT co-antagonist protein RsbR